jgi:hypothetical protein
MSAKFKQDKAIAKAIFVAANPQLTQESLRHNAFLLAHPEWAAPGIVSGSASAESSVPNYSLALTDSPLVANCSLKTFGS